MRQIRLQLVSALALLSAAICAQSVEEGIGINMNDAPLGVFHVNGSDPSKEADDVIIDTEGRMGIGTTSPTARLTIDTKAAAGVYPIRLRDGSQGNGKMMVSGDNEGHAAWQTVTPPAKDVVYMPPVTLHTTTTSYPVGALTKLPYEFPVTEDGFYSADIRWWVEFNNGGSGTPNTPLGKSIIYYQLRRNSNDGQGDVVVDEIKHHEPTRMKWTTFLVLYATAKAGDKLSLYIHVAAYPSGVNTIRFYGVNEGAWVQTKALYKKLGITDSNLFN